MTTTNVQTGMRPAPPTSSKLGWLASVAAALAAAGLGHLYLSRVERELSGGKRVGIVVAARDLEAGAKLTEKNLRVRDVPEAYLDRRHLLFADAKRALGVSLVAPVRSNDAILTSDLPADSAPAVALAAKVERGMRAVAIEGGADFSGLLRPNDRVDVLLTQNAVGKEPGATLTLLQNLRVLAVGSATASNGEGEQSRASGQRVTLSASVEQSQILIQAKQRGRLSLTLRNGEDTTLVEGVPVTSERLIDARAQGGLGHVR
jgi:pilus assembly protein CpaB